MADMPDPAQLAEAIKGLSEEQLDEQIKAMGEDTVLDAIFDRMPEAFIADRAQGVNSTIQYDIKTSEGVKTYSVAFQNGTCTTSKGPAQDPRLTLGVGITDFVRLIFGQVEGPQLFMSGKLQLKGDMMFAMQMQGYFDRNF